MTSYEKPLLCVGLKGVADVDVETFDSGGGVHERSRPFCGAILEGNAIKSSDTYLLSSVLLDSFVIFLSGFNALYVFSTFLNCVGSSENLLFLAVLCSAVEYN